MLDKCNYKSVREKGMPLLTLKPWEGLEKVCVCVCARVRVSEGTAVCDVYTIGGIKLHPRHRTVSPQAAGGYSVDITSCGRIVGMVGVCVCGRGRV